MESDKTIEDGVGMRLDLEGKRTLTIGVVDLVLSGTEVPEVMRGDQI